MKSLKNVAGFGRRTLRSSLALLSVPLGEQASGKTREVGLLGLGHVERRGFGTKWYDDVPGTRSTRGGDTGNEDNISFARFLKPFAMRRAQKSGDLVFCINDCRIIFFHIA